MRRGPQGPANNELRVEGHLDAHWSTRFDRMALVREDDGTTTLRGLVADQPHCTAYSRRCAISAPP